MKLKPMLLILLSAGAVGLSAAAISAPVFTAAPAAVARESEESYTVRTVNGAVCVFRGGTLLTVTDISLLSLPAADRAQLEAGIPLSDLSALSSLLEDLDS